MASVHRTTLRTACTGALAALLGATAFLGTANARPHAPRIERVSLTADLKEADGPSSGGAISDNGRLVAFVSAADNLGCSTYMRCMQVRDLATGAVTTVKEGGGLWTGPTMSGDGRRIGYSAGNRYPAPYLYDRTTGQSQRIWPATAPGDVELGEVQAISRHGDHIVYTLGNRHGPAFTRYLYVRDTATGTDELLSGADEPPKSWAASISADGTVVAYMTLSTSDEPADTAHVFVVDRTTGRKVQADAGIGQGQLVQLSDNGRYVVFTARGGTYVRDLHTGHLRRVADAPAQSASRDTRYLLLSGTDGLRLFDRHTGRTVGVGPAGSQSVPGAVSAGGRAVVFGSAAADLVPDDTNGVADVFVRLLR
ncbi:hypothetical protein ABT173_27755 [Streptomyces sp. NPDC001795]|uniref:hypothetical protein n=1 Tax=Streptomyces sp. NPDC001795 TaxID=3154525 RepID=UPI003331A672